MTSYFEEEMVPTKLGGVDNIPISSRKIDGGRATKSRQYPNRDGQKSEDLGREAWRFELEIPLFKGIDDSHYPDMHDQLVALLDDPPNPLEYRDHEKGTMNVTIPPGGWSSTIDAKIQDGAVIRVTLIEDQLDVAVSARELRPTQNAQARGEDLDEALRDAGVDEDKLKKKLDKAGVGLSALEQGFAAGSMWSNVGLQFQLGLRDAVRTTQQIAADVDTMRARVDVVFGLPQLLHPVNAGIVDAAILLADTFALIGEAHIQAGPVIVEEVINDTTNAFSLATRLYGDTSRVEELLALNPSIDPLFIRPGTRLQVAA